MSVHALPSAPDRPNDPVAAVIADLKDHFGERLTTAEAVRQQQGKDESFHPSYPPDAVVFAQSTQEVQRVVQACARHRVPVIPTGTNTSLEGHVNALNGGIAVDVMAMDRVLRVSPEDMDCTVEPGVTRKALNEHLRDLGLMFPIDPGANASIGGMTATRASGTNAVRYGTMRENVLGLDVVTADGKVIHTGGRARKSSAGYDLTRLFVGSEGTLGIITGVTLRLHGIPEAMSSAVCAFPSLQAAVDTTIQTIQAGVPVARIECLDDIYVDAVNRYSKLDYPVAPTLFLEFHGSEASVAEQAELVGAIAAENGGQAFQWTTRAEERTKLWQARHDAYYAGLALKPGATGFVTDVCVPISALAEVIVETKRDIEEAGIVAPILGHVGDGNFHVIFLVTPGDDASLARAKQLNARMLDRAIAVGGTCTGEHGVGHGKMAYLEQEHGAEALGVMASIKRALDPDNIMNPGKIVRVG